MTGSFAVVRYLSILMLGFTNFFMDLILSYLLGFVKFCVLCYVMFLDFFWVCGWVNGRQEFWCFIMVWL